MNPVHYLALILGTSALAYMLGYALGRRESPPKIQPPAETRPLVSPETRPVIRATLTGLVNTFEDGYLDEVFTGRQVADAIRRVIDRI